MSENAAIQEPEDNYLNMSDEEVAQIDISAIEPSNPRNPDDVPDEPEAKADVKEEVEPEETEESEESGLEDKEKPEAVKEEVEEEATEESSDEKEETQEIDYKAAYEQVFKPFKANGKEIKVNTPEEVIQLMQMGANYSKKMAALKPNLKLLKTLQNNDLLSEEKLNFLIDLSKKNPDAIQKLVKESGIDPLDMDLNKESEYRPSSYTVHDKEIELDEVLEEIQGTPTYARTIDLIGNTWDGASKQQVANTPQLLKVLNDHMASGVYDIISKELENERLFGRLDGLSDLEAYRKVGDAIQARGGFDHLFQAKQSQTVVAKKVITPASKAEDPNLKSKKKALSPSKSNGSAPKGDFDPLALSDEEFMKIAQSKFI